MFTATSKDDSIPTLKNSAQRFRENANEAKRDLSEAAHQAGQKVRNIYNTACDEASHVKETVTTQIRTNPVQSSLIALGIGVVLGALMRR